MNVDSGHSKQIAAELLFYMYSCSFCQYFKDGSYFRADIDRA